MTYTVLQGNNIDLLKSYPDNHFDSIVTDPPYGISFLGKDWDSFKNSKVTKNSIIKNLGSGMRMTTHKENLNFQIWCEEWAKECFRVLKPGGYMLSFCAARMYHRMTVGLEDAGFEIRDQIMWIYSSGFPKSQDVGKSIQRTNKTEEPNDLLGWGTALKPAHEPIALARKPMKLSIAKNAQKYGTGALNIDATRVPIDDQLKQWYAKYPEQKSKDGVYANYNPELQDKLKVKNTQPIDTTEVQGRFPSNVIGEIPDYQKYFYCPKVSRRERHTGFELPPPMFGNVQGAYDPETGERYAVTFDSANHKGNNHPTVKPVELMKYLIKLVTPQGGHVLDPFCGSGSTGMAAVELGYDFTGCELDPAYVNIALKRIAAWNQPTETQLNEEWFDDK